MQFAFRTAEKMSVIDKERIHPACAILQEERLAVIGMTGADVYQPGKPEVQVVTDPLQAGSGQDFQQSNTISTEKAGTKTQTRTWPKTSLRGLYPAVLGLIDEVLGDHQWLPRRHRQSASSVKLASDALVEQQIGALEIIDKLDHIK